MDTIDIVGRLFAVLLVVVGFGYTIPAYGHLEYDRRKSESDRRSLFGTLTGKSHFTPLGYRRHLIGMIIMSIGIVLQLVLIW